MTLTGFAIQFLNGLADASSLFLVAVGLSLIFGVSRIVNFAHGSLYMLGIYLAYSLVNTIMPSTILGFWISIFIAAVLVAIIGAAIEFIILRRIYHAPELFQLLATFALVLVINDAVLWFWGAEDLLGPLAPGLKGSIHLFERYIPEYDLLLITLGPIVLLVLWLALSKSHWGALLRAATQDRSMLSALGVNQAYLFTAVFALGSFLAGLGGALQIPRQPANLELDISIIADAFVVVVVGGMGSIPGAYVAALLISQIKALCIALGAISFGFFTIDFPSITLAAEFILMAVVLIFKPWGLFGGKPSEQKISGLLNQPIKPLNNQSKAFYLIGFIVFALMPFTYNIMPYAITIAQDMLIAAIFAISLHLLMGPGGVYSFGHAAFFGLGAYGSALLFKTAGFSMLASLAIGPFIALAAAAIFGWFCIRLSGVYLAMLTLAFAQIIWSIIYQWDSFTGGSNGIIGIWPDSLLTGDTFYYFVLAVLVISVYLIRRMIFAPFGFTIRAIRDSQNRAQALGINTQQFQLLLFIISGLFAGIAGAIFVFAKGGVSPEALSISKSVDALLMVLLGGINYLSGPVIGAGAFQIMQDFFTGITEYWHALFGGVILFLVLIFPNGLADSTRLCRFYK